MSDSEVIWTEASRRAALDPAGTAGFLIEIGIDSKFFKEACELMSARYGGPTGIAIAVAVGFQLGKTSAE